jgi:hypothetical protein
MGFYVQDERYFAKEHMDVRREAFQVGTAIQWVSIKVHQKQALKATQEHLPRREASHAGAALSVVGSSAPKPQTRQPPVPANTAISNA